MELSPEGTTHGGRNVSPFQGSDENFPLSRHLRAWLQKCCRFATMDIDEGDKGNDEGA